MSVQTDIFGVVKTIFYFGSKKDKLLYSFFECASVVIDWTFGFTKLRPELYDGSRSELRAVCFIAIALYSLTNLTPWLMTILNDDAKSNYWVFVISSAYAPLNTLLIDKTDGRRKIFYTTIGFFVTWFSLPVVWPKNPWVFVVCQAGLGAESLLHGLQQKYGEFRLEMGLGSAVVMSTLYILFGTRSVFTSQDAMNLAAFTAFAWAFQISKSRFSAKVKNNPFVMAMARLEQVLIHVMLFYLIMPANVKYQASGMASVFAIVLCLLAAKKYYE